MCALNAQAVIRLEALVGAADPAWASAAGGTPLLRLPKSVFEWSRTAVYFANSGLAPTRELYVEIRAFDGAERRRLDPSEIDWCIPIAYAGASEIERLGWEVGFGEGWSDSFVVVRLRFDARYRGFFSNVLRERKLALAQNGAETASLLTQLDRNLRDIASFVGTAEA